MTRPAKQAKPKKPSKTYPLTAHGSGQWCKVIRGRRYYFGPWSDPAAAKTRYEAEFPYLQAGQPVPSNQTTLSEVLNAFDDHKDEQLKNGRINQRTYDEYMDICEIIKEVIGAEHPFETITPHLLQKLNNRLKIGKGGSPVSATQHKKFLTNARSVFYYANEILEFNLRYKVALKPPSIAEIRKERKKAGEKMFEPEQLRLLLKKANPHMKAVILLGLNCGYGPQDCIQFTTDKIKDGFIYYPRPKTGVDRICPLWPETQKAIAAITNGEHVFNGRKWTRHIIARQFMELCKECEIYRKGITSPYSLRRTFETVAKNSGVNQSVVDAIMGHERPQMSEIYNQRTFKSQLQKCVNFVHRWMEGKVKL